MNRKEWAERSGKEWTEESREVSGKSGQREENKIERAEERQQRVDNEKRADSIETGEVRSGKKGVTE